MARKCFELPAFCLPEPGEPRDGAALLATLALARLEGKWIHLSAASQRKVLGFPVFGKCRIRSRYDKTHGQYVIDMIRTTGYGLDFESGSFTLGEITKAAKAKTTLRIG